MFPRLLGVLQLTRMALVFTAIADVQAALVLADLWSPRVAAAGAGVSVGLYGFGMALNDIVDQRRDATMAGDRPLPAGRVGSAAAHFVAFALLAGALASGWWLDRLLGNDYRTLAAVALCGGLIGFYDLTGKYLTAVGLVTLGIVRFIHAAAPTPDLTYPGQPLVLLNFVAVLSTIGYALEDKRPTLRAGHVLVVALVLGAINTAVLWHRPFRLTSPTVGAVIAAILLFGLVAGLLAAQTTSRRQLGKKVMLFGLLWLIVIDAAAVIAARGWRPGLLILGLAPVAYVAVWFMRTWSRLVALSQKPTYIRD